HSEFPNYGCVQIRMYNAIVNAVREKILPNDKFSFVIPSGTAVQNLRTSFSGDKLTRDGYHMSYKNGRAVTALMWAKQISGCPLGVIDLSSSGYNFSDDERDAIRDAVDKAYEHPFEVTPSAYPPQRFMHVSDPEVVKAFTDAGYDLSKYRELDYYINLWAFWNSTSSARYFSKDTGSSDPMTNHFACTGLFSSEDIPAGSVLVLKKGYQYRPDAWKRLSMANASSARPGNVVASNAPSVVKVDEEWWGSYAYRVFNLAEAGIPDLDQERMEALRSCLSIFVPKAE
ncbi:DUF4886 domain-containing protein, partial [bacterium]|nr:DUF4886 domain-containing protein [bacterium]